jgi:transcriptional regulator with XRE-family HTH domain
MTIKEIAELCGVDRRTVERWAHKIADDLGKNFQGLAVKLAEAEKSGKDPADFTLDETLAIIGEGGENKALASLLAETAATKNALLSVQSEAMAKIAKLAEKLPEWAEWHEKVKDLPKRFEELEKETMESYKGITAELDVAEMLIKGKGRPYPNFLGGSLWTN